MDANYTFILIIAFLLIGILYIIVFTLFYKIKNIENRLMDVSYDDLQVLINELKDLLLESERVSEQIDNSLKEKESLLEDLVDLLDSKIARIESSYTEKSEKDLKTQIIDLHNQGMEQTEIAKKLNISVTEVGLVLKMFNEN